MTETESSEVIDTWTMAGAMVIVLSATYIAHREAQLARRKRSDR